jgi:isopenicillin-N epimerase
MTATWHRRIVAPGAHDFPLEPGVTLVNHASYGIATRRSLAIAGEIRGRFEGDSMRQFGELVVAHRAAARAGAQFTGLTDGEFALTANATAGASAVAASLALTPDSAVVVLGTEYPSVIRTWEVAAARTGATLHVLEVPLPVTCTDDLVKRLDTEVSGKVDLLQASFVSSASALVLDLASLHEWVDGRGGRLIVDAAHGPGHVACAPVAEHAAIAFGTLHKWLPVPRGVGFLWTAPGTPETLRPAEVSLSHDEAAMVDRFGWPGTFDPAPRLTLPDAIVQWHEWSDRGALTHAAALCDHATIRLQELGAIPTGPPSMRPPRMQAVILPGVALEAAQRAMDEARVRPWLGRVHEQTVLRLATHVHTGESDVQRALAVVSTLL